MSKFRPCAEQNIYIIPDVHGCSEQLQLILDRILPLRPQDKLIFLGDYCDRGPDSPGVLDICIDLRKKYTNEQVIFIRGNHDALLLSVSGRDHLGFDPSLPSAYSILMNNGGDVTFQQFAARKGVEIKKPKELTIDRALSFIDAKYFDFLQKETQTLARIGNYIFCHAGYDVNLPYENQDDETLMWDRSLYYTVKKFADQGKELPWAKDITIVSGHNYDGPWFYPGFLMIDGSAKNKLFILELNSMECFSASPGHDRLVKYKVVEAQPKPVVFRRVVE